MGLITNKNIEIGHAGWLDVFDGEPVLRLMEGSWPGLDDLANSDMTYRDLASQEILRIIRTCFPSEGRMIPLLKEALYMLTHMGEYDCTQFQRQLGKRKSDNFTVRSMSVDMNSLWIDKINNNITVQQLYDPDLLWKIRVSRVSFNVIYPGGVCMYVMIQQYSELITDRGWINVVGNAIMTMSSGEDNIYLKSLKNLANFEEL